jgi:hypothetical protein
MILPKVRDPRLITIRRGGTLTDADHRLLALWAATCAEHVLPLFEHAVPDDLRPRQAINAARSWVRGELPMMRTRTLGGHAMGAARPLRGAPRFAAYAAGQAACVAHVPEHDLGAAAYAIKAAQARCRLPNPNRSAGLSAHGNAPSYGRLDHQMVEARCRGQGRRPRRNSHGAGEAGLRRVHDGSFGRWTTMFIVIRQEGGVDAGDHPRTRIAGGR